MAESSFQQKRNQIFRKSWAYPHLQEHPFLFICHTVLLYHILCCSSFWISARGKKSIIPIDALRLLPILPSAGTVGTMLSPTRTHTEAVITHHQISADLCARTCLSPVYKPCDMAQYLVFIGKHLAQVTSADQGFLGVHFKQTLSNNDTLHSCMR